MVPPLAIRHAREDAELEEIQRLAGVIWRDHYPGIITPEQIEYMLDRMYSLDALRTGRDVHGVRHELAWSGPTPIGYCAYGPEATSGEPKLHSLYVHRDHRGHGCGSALLERAIAWARDRDAKHLILNVNKHNRLALDTYAHYGFRVREPVVNDIGSGFVMDDYVMELTL